VQGFTKNIRDRDVTANKHTKVLIGEGQLRFRPGEGRDVCTKGGGEGGDDFGFVNIDTQTRSETKLVYKLHGLPKIKEGPSSESQVVSTGMGGNIREERKTLNKNIITNDKENGGEGTALFDSSHDIDPIITRGAKGKLHLRAREEASCHVDEPLGKTSALKSSEDKGVVDRIKSFSSIHEEDKKILVGVTELFYYAIEAFVQRTNVLLKATAFDKAFLRVMQNVANSGGDSFDQCFCNNAIVSVGDRDRPGILGEESTFFGDEEKETKIVALGGGAASGEVN